MALNFLLKRSGTADKRPDPASMALGELDLNYDAETGGVFYKDSDGNISKVGSAQVSATAPNATPAGSAGNSTGEFWYDTSTSALKMWDGTAWVATGGGGGGGVAGVTGTAPITVDNTDPANPVVGVDAASTLASGVVQLNDTTSSTSTTEAATANAVKTAYDAAVAAQGSADSAIPCASLTAKGDLIAASAASTPTALPVGTDGQVLSANSACASGLEWVEGGTALPTGATDGQFLVADSACPTGLTWANNPTQPTETSSVCSVASNTPPVGTALEGGYFGGYISTTADGVADYALIVAPKASGEFCRRWWWCNCENTPPEVFNNTVYGKPATECGATISGMDTFRCANNLTIGGCTDWYVPAFYELDILYKNLKPDLPGACFTCPCSNDPFSGCNPYSVPPQNETYCSPNNPTRTTATAFRRNQSEAFFSARYWTATQYNSFGNYACTLDFNDGGDNQVNKTNAYYSRAIRRVPASALGSGQILSFPDSQGLTALSVGDTINQDTTCASGTITCVDLVNCQVTVESVTGAFQDGYAIPLTPGYIPFPTSTPTDSQVLAACAVCDGGVTWVDAGGGIDPSILTAKGDIIVATAASTPTALPVGTDGQVLSANSACGGGLEWVDAGGGGGGTPATVTAGGILYGCTGENTGPYQFSTVLGCSTTTQGPLLDSVAIGNQVWTGTLGASGGVIIGNCAGCLTSGVGTLSDVVFIGKQAALCAATNAAGSVVIGGEAGQEVGNNNTYIGQGAAPATQGCRNVAVGCGSLPGAGTTTSALNTAVGALALNTTGACNTALGMGAGNSGSAITGSNNSFIGFGATPIATTCSNQITFGNASINRLRAAVTTISTLSDARDKTNVISIPVGLDFINALNPVKFTWQMREPNEVKDGTSEAGFIAQELQSVEEQFGTTSYLDMVDGTDERLEAAAGKLLPVLVKAVQELSAKNDDLEARLTALEGN